VPFSGWGSGTQVIRICNIKQHSGQGIKSSFNLHLAYLNDHVPRDVSYLYFNVHTVEHWHSNTFHTHTETVEIFQTIQELFQNMNEIHPHV